MSSVLYPCIVKLVIATCCRLARGLRLRKGRGQLPCQQLRRLGVAS